MFLSGLYLSGVSELCYGSRVDLRILGHHAGLLFLNVKL